MENYLTLLDINLNLPSNEQWTLLHRWFEVLDRFDSHELLERATGFVFTPEQFGSLRYHARVFYTWLEKELGEQTRQHEVSILTQDDRGSVMTGFIDLLVETEAGFWIVDHKSDSTADRQNAFWCICRNYCHTGTLSPTSGR